MRVHSSVNLDIKSYYEKETWFNSVYSGYNLPTVKDATYAINSNKYANIENHWVAIYFKNSDTTYFDTFSIDYKRD